VPNIISRTQTEFFKIILMSHEHLASSGKTSLIITAISIMLSYITLDDAGKVVSLMAGIIAIISGLLAARYYYKAGKKLHK